MNFAPTLWDKVVTLGDPRRQLQRTAARAQMEFMSRSFQGEYEAGGSGRRLGFWRPAKSGPNSASRGRVIEMRARHRQLLKDNPWAKRAVQAIVTHTVGHGITVEFKSRKKDAASRRKALEWLNDLWGEWFESSACDWDERKDGYGLQALALGETAAKGDVFARARWLPGSSKAKVPLQVQLVPTELCDETKTEAQPFGGDAKIIHGVGFDSRGKRSSLWMFDEHPYDVIPAQEVFAKRRPIADYVHMYIEREIGQVRGVPWGHAVLTKVKELDGYEDAYLFRQKLANCFAAFVHDTDAPSFNPSSASQKSVLPDSLEPGAVLGLPAGKKITFNAPPLAGDYGPFTRDVLMAVAAGYGITYQMLTGDLRAVNFTSGRMGLIDAWKNIDDWRWLMLVPQFIEPITRWFIQAVELKYGADLSDIYAECTPPKRELMDPPREVPAEIAAVRGGLWSMPESHRSRGMRPKKVLQEISEWNQQLDDAEVVLDTDPRKVSAQGLAQPIEEPAEPAEPATGDAK